MEEGQSAYEVFNDVHIHRISLRERNGKLAGGITAKPIRTTVLLWSLFTILAARQLASLHHKLNFDVIHAHNLPDFLVFVALVPKIRGAQVILHVQDVSPELMAARSKGLVRNITVPLAKLQERASTAFADHVLTVGWPFEERLLKRGVPKGKLSIVINSADPSIFSAAKRTDPFLGDATAERPLVLMYHGTLAHRCGLDIALRALAQARVTAPHLRLHLRGAGEALPSLKALAETLGLSHNVVFFPTGSMEQVADFIVQGDIGIIPYRSDGFMDMVLPTKAYEFALMRRPMIASDTIAMRSMFPPSSVLLCQPENEDSFARAIVDLYCNPGKRAQLAARAEQGYARYRWENVAESYAQLLSSLVARSCVPR
jgi:glycosyltransferase involved in cell wall biosynthesis